jgi:F-type H+-transporting ATPase subunit delta
MVLATRYAKSLLDLSLEKGQVETVYKDMLMVQDVCRANRDFVLFLNSPIIKADKKSEVFQGVFKGKVHEITLNFIEILTRKRRESYIDDIAEAFISQYKQHKKILTAIITSAAGIDDTTRSKVMELVKSTAQGEVELVEKIDKNLIGGFVIRIGDRQVDASVSRKLTELRKSFSENPLIKEF